MCIGAKPSLPAAHAARRTAEMGELDGRVRAQPMLLRVSLSRDKIPVPLLAIRRCTVGS